MNLMSHPDSNDPELKIKHLRLFYALWPDPATRNALALLQPLLRGRIVLPQNLHITLAFLGDQPVYLLPSLRSILGRLNFPRIDLKLDRLGYFSKNRIAWIGMNTVPPELAELHTALHEYLEKNGIRHDARAEFTPHITLARNANQTEAASFIPIDWKADHVALVHSPMNGAGSAYRVIAFQQLMHR